MRYLALLVLLALASGCDKESDASTKADAKEEAVVPVEVVEAKLGNITATLLSTANARARSDVHVYAQTRGIAREIAVDEGDVVKKGDLLARLGDPEQELAVPAAAATVSRLERERSSLEPLVERGFVARQQYDELKAQLRSAKDQLARTRASVAHLRVKAPIDGIIAARSLDPGQQATPGQELFHIVDPNEIEVDIQVPERSLSSILQGGEGWVEAEAAGSVRFPAKVRLVGPVVNPQSGTVKVTLHITSPEVADKKGRLQRLRPGMFVRVRLITDRREDVVLIPKRAVVYEDDVPHVFVLEEKDGVLTSTKAALELGFDEDSRVQVNSGLSAGQRVVVLGQSGLANGATVELVQ